MLRAILREANSYVFSFFHAYYYIFTARAYWPFMLNGWSEGHIAICVSRARARTLKHYAMDPNVGVDYRNLGTDYQRFKASNDVAHKDPLP